ncbi:MAG: hypothetical protein ACTJHY_07810 [Alcaligenes pakistanensis]
MKSKQSAKSRSGVKVQHGRKPSRLLRSKSHRQNVVSLGCLITGRPAQACHVNFGKGMGIKACDSLCFPLCPELHRQHDQGGMPRTERWKKEWEYVDATRALMIRKGLWTDEIEAHYQQAIEPLSRVVHADLGKEKAAWQGGLNTWFSKEL